MTTRVPQRRDKRTPEQKRYARYPNLHAFLKSLTGDQLQAIRKWHSFMRDGLRLYIVKYPQSLVLFGFTKSEKAAAVQALNDFGRTLADIGAVADDLRPSDWCCATGMMAYPEPCEVHRQPYLGEVRWVDGRRRVFLEDGWHHWGARLPDEEQS